MDAVRVVFMLHDKKFVFRIALLAAMLIILYQFGIPAHIIAILGATTAVFMAFRGRTRDYISGLMHLHIPGFKGLHPWAKAALLLVAFIFVYIVLKQAVYFLLYLLGFDIQASIQDAVNNQ